MTAPVLVLNAGSSSLKYQVVDPDTGDAVVAGLVERIADDAEHADHGAALESMREDLRSHGVEEGDLLAIGHRVVHGGPRLVAPTLVDDEALAEIEACARLAPLHNPPAAAGIRLARREFPTRTQVAVFDTGFFADLPAASSTYAIDREVAEREDIRRYGAHGISHQYVAGEVARLLDCDPAELDQIVLHLGNGASAAAISGGRPIDTSMGMTPLEGLVMGTRAGDLDPGVLLHLIRHAGMDLAALEDLLHHHSGLVGMVGSSDFRDLEASVEQGDPDAVLAYAVVCHRLRTYVGAYHALLGGADVITFTAGIGEHAPTLRADALFGLDRLGIVVDEEVNASVRGGPHRISADTSDVVVLVVPTNEEWAIARDVRRLVEST